MDSRPSPIVLHWKVNPAVVIISLMLSIRQQEYNQMLAEAQAVFPLEACGLLAGEQGRARRLYPIDNVLQSPSAFLMDTRQQVAAMLEMERHGWELLAIYHSHPQGPEEPSTTDVAQAYYPEAIHLILSLADRARPCLRAFRIVDGRIEEKEWQLVQP
jgi:[CysO sulfur-carrier protein]-S-L-cysteine hydrolase